VLFSFLLLTALAQDTLPATATETAERIAGIQETHARGARARRRMPVQPCRKLDRKTARRQMTTKERAEFAAAVERVGPRKRDPDRDCR
jgi:hypothetical protein